MRKAFLGTRNNQYFEEVRMIKGKRIILRPVFRSDVKNFISWFNNPEITQYLVTYLPITDIAEEKWIEDLSISRKDTDVVFVIEVIMGRKKIPVGTVGLHKIDWKNRDAEFGIAIGEKKFWGNGYGTEATKLILDYAFNQLNFHRVSSAAYDFNARSVKMHIRVGLKEEGRVRQSIFKNGQYQDKIIFGILQKEWEK